MNQSVPGESSPRDIPSTAQQAQDILTEMGNLAGRCASDTDGLLHNPSDQDFFFNLQSDQIRSEIAEHFIDPLVDDPSKLGEATYSLYVSRILDEQGNPKETDVSHVTWISFTKSVEKPNGVSYDSTITYTVVSEANAPIYHLERKVDLEKILPERITEIAERIHLLSHIDDVEDHSEGRLEELNRLVTEHGDDEDIADEVGRLTELSVKHMLGSLGLAPQAPDTDPLHESMTSMDTAKEHGLNDVSFPEADAVLKLLEVLDLFDQ